jgi:hypothetical protein
MMLGGFGGFKFFGVVDGRWGGSGYRRECRANHQGHACVLEHLWTHVSWRGERLLHRLRRKRVIDDASSRSQGWGKDLLGAWA